MADMGSIGVGHDIAIRLATVVPLSQYKGIGHNYFSRLALMSGESVAAATYQHCPNVSSKNIHGWSARPNTVSHPVYLTDTPGVIAGTLKTATVIDYNHIVRLYYRPNGYLIDQVYTKSDGSFVFNRNVDKAEIQNYFVVAFDLNNNTNAIVADLLTPG